MWKRSCSTGIHELVRNQLPPGGGGGGGGGGRFEPGPGGAQAEWRREKGGQGREGRRAPRTPPPAKKPPPRGGGGGERVGRRSARYAGGQRANCKGSRCEEGARGSEAARSVGKCDPPGVDRKNQHASREVMKGPFEDGESTSLPKGFASCPQAAASTICCRQPEQLWTARMHHLAVPRSSQAWGS